MKQSFLPGDILFVRGHNPLSKLVEFFDGEFSHCAICCGGDSILETDFFTNSRIVLNHYDDYEIVRLPLTDKQRDKVTHLAVDMVGRHYDYIQILYYLGEHLLKLNPKGIVNSPKNMICSELVVYLLLQLDVIDGVNLTNRLLDSTPNELYKFLKHELNN